MSLLPYDAINKCPVVIKIICLINHRLAMSHARLTHTSEIFTVPKN